MTKSMTSFGKIRINVACFSDIHLFHRKNPTSSMVANLRLAFPDNAETADLDIIFIAGDVFDSLVNLDDDDVAHAISWVCSLLRLCKKHDILLRVLEGTPSHDRGQSAIFETQNKVAKIGADLKYVKELSIEYIERYGITVLYVPDEINSTTEKTLAESRELLRAKGLQQVDFAIMHGVFDHQLPPAALKTIQHHDARAYHELVKDTIFIGHHHKFSVNGRIVAQGSFDRTGHGYEEPKGHVRLVTDLQGNRDLKFVETIGAKIFKTIDCTGLDIEETLEKVSVVADTLPDYSYVRILANSDNPIFTNMEHLIRKYPFLCWDKKQISADEGKVDEEYYDVEGDDSDFVPVSLTRENIESIMLARITGRAPSLDILNACERLLRGVI